MRQYDRSAEARRRALSHRVELTFHPISQCSIIPGIERSFDGVARWALDRRVAETIRVLNARYADTGATTAFSSSVNDNRRTAPHSLAASAAPRCSRTPINLRRAPSPKQKASLDRQATIELSMDLYNNPKDELQCVAVMT